MIGAQGVGTTRRNVLDKDRCFVVNKRRLNARVEDLACNVSLIPRNTALQRERLTTKATLQSGQGNGYETQG
jgi:hypothetical protein|tara:strand:+ start:925 stop:1140 length:216 start_codon:yes stop_codon:yes gene_type:complete